MEVESFASGDSPLAKLSTSIKSSPAAKAQPLEGLSGHAPSPPPHPRKFSNLKALKRHFQHSQADSCEKKVPKIDRYFRLNMDKRALSLAVVYFRN